MASLPSSASLSPSPKSGARTFAKPKPAVWSPSIRTAQANSAPSVRTSTCRNSTTHSISNPAPQCGALPSSAQKSGSSVRLSRARLWNVCRITKGRALLPAEIMLPRHQFRHHRIRALILCVPFLRHQKLRWAPELNLRDRENARSRVTSGSDSHWKSAHIRSSPRLQKIRRTVIPKNNLGFLLALMTGYSLEHRILLVRNHICEPRITRIRSITLQRIIQRVPAILCRIPHKHHLPWRVFASGLWQFGLKRQLASGARQVTPHRLRRTPRSLRLKHNLRVVTISVRQQQRHGSSQERRWCRQSSL